ncbi:MAG TPA: HK97 gp10 family phage protein [Verrucomicrobiota bacterium]|nr:HK97 gp10 family phage protein [Verrucomicrobiota bacterium]
MPDVTIRIEGLDKVLAKFGRIEGVKFLKGIMGTAALDIKDWIAEYAPATEANSPSRPRWYERGYGPRWRRMNGSIGGSRTSETLGRRWTTKVAADGMQAEVGNNASYARYVQDADMQARFHKARGWRTIQEAAEAKGPGIIEKVRATINALLKG